MRPHRALRTLSVSAALLCIGTCLHAQAPAFAPAAASANASLATEPYYFKTWSDVISMHADGTGTRTETISAVVQSQAALQSFSVVSLVYASQSEHADFIYVRVIHPDGAVQETPLSSAIEQPVAATQQAPEYSDLKSKQLPIRSLRVGDTVEWQTRFVVDHPLAPNQFWGQDTFLHGVVVLDETYELHVPTGFHLTVWTNPHSGVTPSQSDANGEHIYRWHRTDLKPTVGAAAEAAKKAEQTRPRTAEEEADDTKGALPGFAWSTFADYAAIGEWYRTLNADRVTPDAAIKAKVAELTAGKTTDLEKAQAVYNYVSSQIHYIGVDFGVGRYQPHSAAEVFANQYGDCKDKHTLLASMLSVLNIHADPVLIGAGLRFNPAVASPAAFNHLITHVSLGGKDVWLDATSEVAPWESLLNVLRDKEALLIPAAGPPAIRQTPKDLPYPQVSSMTVVGSLDKDLTADSTITITMHDDSEIYVRSALRSVSPSSYSEFVQRLMSGMGFGGTTSDAAINYIDDPSRPLEITFHYHRVKEKDWGENRITATFEFIDAPGFTPDHPPIEAVQLGAPRTETSTVKMQLPKGWSAELPETVHAHTPFANVDVTYHLDNGTLTEERRYTVLQKEVPLKDAKQYQSWYDEAGASGYPYIQLRPAPIASSALSLSTPEAPSAALAEVRASDAKAADLVREAFKSLQAMDLDAGRKDLDEAAKINPTEPGLWAGYANAAQLLGKQSEVVADLEHEVTFHPDEAQYYSLLYNSQSRMGRPDAAIITLRAWEKAAPGNPDPPYFLVSMLDSMKKPADAVLEGRQAMDRLDAAQVNDEGLRIATAIVQAELGQTKEAVAAVEPLLKTVTNSARLNNIDYVLALANADLDEAHATQIGVVGQAEAQTADWSPDTNIGNAFGPEVSLASAWDTLGWILYRQGKLDDAFSFCLAARFIEDDASVRDHLTAIAAALHKPSALAVARKSDQDLRTIRLAPPEGRHGLASVRLLLADGKIAGMSADQMSRSPNGPPQLKDVDALLAHADVHAMLPAGSTARLVRAAMVNCSTSSCDLVLMPVLQTSTPSRPSEAGHPPVPQVPAQKPR